MKTSLLLLVPIIILASCKKDTTVVPDTASTTSKPATTNTSTSTSSATQSQQPSAPANPQQPATPATPPANTFADTLANLSAIKIKLAMDSTNYDETMFLFRKTATVDFNAAEDAQYLQGYGQVSLASVAPDGSDLAINSLPYTPNMTMKLDFQTKSDGAYLLKISYTRTLPSTLQIWIKDNYTQASANLRSGNYKFNVTKADAASYGANRFTVVLKTVQ